MKENHKFSGEETKRIEKTIKHLEKDLEKNGISVGKHHNLFRGTWYEINGPCYQMSARIKYIDKAMGYNMRCVFGITGCGPLVIEPENKYDIIRAKISFGIEKKYLPGLNKILFEVPSHIAVRNIDTTAAMKSGIILLDKLNEWGKEHGKFHSATYGYDDRLSYYYILKEQLN
jgi:hypothetical protein